MNWFYILIRTFPFWIIPIGLVTLGHYWRGGGKKWLALGLVFCASGIYFLYNQGHFTAVPFMHDVMNSKAPPSMKED